MHAESHASARCMSRFSRPTPGISRTHCSQAGSSKVGVCILLPLLQDCHLLALF
ncbi:hypothetical protein M3J09_000963 [Ascochyta lentis]